MRFIIHTDGGARGNPGPAAIGIIIESCRCKNGHVCTETHRQQIHAYGKRIGIATNNVAEYKAVLDALEYLRQKKKDTSDMSVDFHLDSLLVVQQLNGMFKVKNAALRELLLMIKTLEQEVGETIRYHVIPRERNVAADSMVNKALDEHI